MEGSYEGGETTAQPEHGRRSGRAGRDQSLLRSAWDWCKSILIAFVLFLVIRAFLVEAFKIPTASMENTLLVGDFLLVNKAVYGAEIPGTSLHLPAFAALERGDVIVFTPPHDPGKNYVKRLIGLPGDVLEMRGKTLYVNGEPQAEPYARHLDSSGDATHPDMGWQREFLPWRRHNQILPPHARQLGSHRHSRARLFRSRRQPGQQRGLALLGVRGQECHAGSTLVRLLLLRPEQGGIGALGPRREVAEDRWADPLETNWSVRDQVAAPETKSLEIRASRRVQASSTTPSFTPTARCLHAIAHHQSGPENEYDGCTHGGVQSPTSLASCRAGSPLRGLVLTGFAIPPLESAPAGHRVTCPGDDITHHPAGPASVPAPLRRTLSPVPRPAGE